MPSVWQRIRRIGFRALPSAVKARDSPLQRRLQRQQIRIVGIESRVLFDLPQRRLKDLNRLRVGSAVHVCLPAEPDLLRLRSTLEVTE